MRQFDGLLAVGSDHASTLPAHRRHPPVVEAPRRGKDGSSSANDNNNDYYHTTELLDLAGQLRGLVVLTDRPAAATPHTMPLPSRCTPSWTSGVELHEHSCRQDTGREICPSSFPNPAGASQKPTTLHSVRQPQICNA
ncbi:hypothetical protein DOTSEDRAFT_30995 [Dothistroma septosporum NZE10]|uniref:Uncharacterized protein n=1 Tax=Dothistroma septosporum (strain NZE10 / CBS 128990) TaxID=675120 RepID=N1Q297_DOTSN|nr:hypothetical protein DOTSEDRAFT_30995 [Dothistroma septosporum NZE10]